MARLVALDREEVRAILSLYHLDGPDDFGDVRAGLTSYWVEVSGHKYFLRITENRRIDDMIFEKEVLKHLERAGLPVPGIVPNVARGSFTPWSARGRYVSLFEYVPGRRLGAFEVRPVHTRRIGQLCARLHRAMSNFSRRRRLPRGLECAQTHVARLERAVERRRLARRHAPAVQTLAAGLARQVDLPRDHLPTGIVHGDFGMGSLRFVQGRPTALVGFEGTGPQRWTWDLATAVLEWGWVPDPSSTEGPQGRFDRSRVRSLLKAYHRMRPLCEDEQAALPEELRLVAICEAAARLAKYELSRSKDGYKDYRHHLRRLEALDEGAAEAMVADAI